MNIYILNYKLPLFLWKYSFHSNILLHIYILFCKIQGNNLKIFSYNGNAKVCIIDIKKVCQSYEAKDF